MTKTYTFELIVTERPSDGYWKGITENGKTGCDDLLNAIYILIDEGDLDFEIKLIKFEDK